MRIVIDHDILGWSDEHRLLRLEEAGHFEAIDPESAAWPRVASEIRMLFHPF